ncbi:MAG TPA: hypothetical protein VIH59_11490, partial [Candidatus Tectomicrobia bacterium]
MLEEKFRVSIHRHYYRICLEQRKAYNELDTSLSSLKHAAVAAREIDLVSEKYQEDYEKREQAAVIAITFAGMCLEAFFYDYAATSLGDTFAADHLDKLDLCSKLLVVPRLVCGTGIEKSSPVY